MSVVAEFPGFLEGKAVRKYVEINVVALIIGLVRLVGSHHDIPGEHVPAAGEPGVGMEGVVHDDVVLDPAVEPFP